jgi:lysophospholipase L1-like esterase
MHRASYRWVTAAFVAVTVSMGTCFAADPVTHWKFAAAQEPGATTLTSADLFSKEKGYGFESGAQIKLVNGALTSEKPFYFSAVVPEGNYRVTVASKAGDAPSDLTIKAELRRLMVKDLHIDPGQSRTVTFTVNVRTPKYDGAGGGSVRLKGTRESVEEAWAWDDKLTLEFNGTRPSIQSMEIDKVDVPTVYLLGDSTVCDQPHEPWNSWGQMFTRFFKDDIAISNQAESGETIASSLAAHRFDKVYASLKPGDYLFMQFGHNDMKDKKPNALETYKADYKKIIETVMGKGVTPVIVSSMERKNGIEKDTLGGYPDAAMSVAKEENVPFIDLHAMSKVFYKALGPDLDKAFQDGTHHNNFGSYEISALVLEGVRKNVPDLAKHIKEDVPRFDPAKPDKAAEIHIPASPDYSNNKPLGD